MLSTLPLVMISFSHGDLVQKFKRKKLEMDELLKIYPNFYNLDLHELAMCGYFDYEKKDECKKAFVRFCPIHFIVDDLQYMQSTNEPVCRWFVDYVAKSGELPNDGPGLETMVNLITQKCPPNCIVVEKRLLRNKKVNIEYGVICNCIPPVFDQQDMRNPSCLEAFRYLNINDNIKM